MSVESNPAEGGDVVWERWVKNRALTRIVVIGSRSLKLMGFHWFDQREPAKGFEDLWVAPAD